MFVLVGGNPDAESVEKEPGACTDKKPRIESGDIWGCMAILSGWFLVYTGFFANVVGSRP